jgi:hypothetical protein
MSNLPGEPAKAAALPRCPATFVDFCTVPHKLGAVKE